MLDCESQIKTVGSKLSPKNGEPNNTEETEKDLELDSKRLKKKKLPLAVLLLMTTIFMAIFKQ